jgi:hypothetical protein
VVGGGAVVLATAGFAYMASNNVPNTRAGDGYGTVSGYTVTNIHYVTTPDDSGYIVSVDFTLDGYAAPSNVFAVVAGEYEPGGPYSAGNGVVYNGCTSDGSNYAGTAASNWVCTYTGTGSNADLADETQLRVVAAQ